MIRCPNCSFFNEDDAEKCERCNESLGRGPTNLRQGTHLGSGNNEKKTQIGANSSGPFLDAPSGPVSPKRMIICQNCNYPNIASATICANCNQSLLTSPEKEKAPTAPPIQSTTGNTRPPQKTVRLEQIQVGNEQSTQGFRLTEEGKKQSLEFRQASTDLNRDGLDKNNMTISSEVHATFEFIDGQWFISDKSSNQATFVQVKGKIPITGDTVIILGNKMYRFEPIE
ncbi:MAG TPA: FHA domain-containing protein [Cyclobacteriaceae bacterium]|nr:FHA domain-containing protein [Cyclobacteriaceae bacterium]